MRLKFISDKAERAFKGMIITQMWEGTKKGWDSRLLGPILQWCYAICVLSLTKGERRGALFPALHLKVDNQTQGCRYHECCY